MDSLRQRQKLGPDPDKLRRAIPIMVDMVIVIIVTALAIMLVLGNVSFAIFAAAGPDSCDQVSCEGDAALAIGFLVLAAISVFATLGAWLAVGFRRRRRVLVALSAIAIGFPLIIDVIAALNMSTWWT
jgi:hypothetical protein